MDERNNPNVKQGFPPGYEFQSRRPHPSEGQRRNKSMSQGLNAAASSFPGGVPGEPVVFRDDGSYDVDDTPPPNAANEGFLEGDEPFDSSLLSDINSQLQNQQPAQQPRSPQNRPQPGIQRVRTPVEPQQPRPAAPVSPAPRANTQGYQMMPGSNAERVQRADHPVLRKIYQKFGLKEIKTYEVKLAAGSPDEVVSFLMTPIPDELQVWAIGEAQAKSTFEGEGSGMSWFEALTACASVVAIDGEPVWKVFNLAPRADEQGLPTHLQESSRLAQNPYDLSIRIRKYCAKELATMFWSDTLPIMDKLHNFYIDRVLSENRILSDFETNIAGKDRFVCPVDSCDVIYFEPLLLDTEQNPLPYFCKVHGVEMVRSAPSPLAPAPESRKR